MIAERLLRDLREERALLGRGLSDRLQRAVAHVGALETPGHRPSALDRFGEHADGIFRVRVRTYRVEYPFKGTGNFLATLGPFFLFLVGRGLITAKDRSERIVATCEAAPAAERRP